MSDLKARRDELWAQLDALLAEYKPREQVIRAEIKEIQETLYDMEMRPVYEMLQLKVSEGVASEFETYKLAVLSGKFG